LRSRFIGPGRGGCFGVGRSSPRLRFQGEAPFGRQCVLVDLIFCRHECWPPILFSLLNDDFLEQHGRNAIGRDGRIDPTGQFLLETIKTRRTVEIGRA